ncbi:MAG TPA: formimidoylglutamase [Edaphocola sp.]|nr:formimidoylglutamase [Edaphocola sp.]
MESLILFQDTDIQNYLHPRIGEQKLGTTIGILDKNNWMNELENSSSKFVILGIPEDIGIRANGGIGGAFTAWESFLSAFLNTQDNIYLHGKDITVLGNVFVQDIMDNNTLDASVSHLRASVEIIDQRVFPIIEKIISLGKIPVVIGGGHNNVFPILKGTSIAKGKSINVINMDAHADFRALEGRHSGNGFSYAYEQNYLNKYAAFGLHEAYNNTKMVNDFKNNQDLLAIWVEDIYLRNKLNFKEGLQTSLSFVSDDIFGVELDLDSIQDTLSSAQSPLGFSRLEACNYLYNCGKEDNAVYLHLPEGVAVRNDGLQYPFIGKLISYLVQSFIKGKLESLNNS